MKNASLDVASVGSLLSLAKKVGVEVSGLRKTAESESLYPQIHAREVVVKYSKIATAIGASPIPFSDATILAPTQVAMFLHINRIFGIKMSKKTVAAFVVGLGGILGVSYVGRMVVSNVFKLIPGLGTLAGGAINAFMARGLTVMLGKAYINMVQKHSTTLQKSRVNADEMVLMFQPFLQKIS